MSCWPNYRRILPALGHRHSVLLLLLLLLLTACSPRSAARAQAPQLGYVYPPAVRIGETTSVALGGYDLTADTQYFLLHPHASWSVDGELSDFHVPPPPYWFGEKGRLSAFPIPRETSASVKVAEAAPGIAPGIALWQVANANGVSAPAPIYLSDVQELREERWRSQPQLLPILATGEAYGVSGRLMRIAEVDAYEFRVAESTEVHLDLMARRLGADFHAVVTIEDSQGIAMVDAADTLGKDVQASFVARPEETYLIKLHDVDYRGNRAFVYRFGLAAGARVHTHLPTRGAPGHLERLRCLGPQLDLETTVRCGDDAAGFVSHEVETPHGRATVRLPILEGFPDPEPIVKGAQSQQVDDAVTSSGQSIAWDLTNARADAVARLQWEVRLAPGRWRVEALSERIGGELDLSLEVLGAEGKTLGKMDDSPGTSDAQLVVNVGKEAVHRIVVDELSGMVGQFDSIGRVSVQPLEPGFRVTAPQQLAAPIGGKFSWKFTAERNGYDGPIQLEFAGLPAGIAAPTEAVIPEKKSSLVVSLEVPADAPAAAASVEVWASGEGERTPVTATVPTLAAGLHTSSRFLLATTLKPKYKLLLIDKNRQRAVHRGTTYPAPFIIQRDEGFEGAVRLQMASKQGRHRQGIRGPILTVPRGVADAFYPCFMPEWLETDRTTRMVVLGVATQQDPQGHPREVTQKADARITMILEGALLSVQEAKSAGERGEHLAKFGDVIELPFLVSRSQKLPLPVQVELAVPRELEDWCDAEPFHLTPDQSRGVLQLRIGRVDDEQLRRRLQGTWPLTIRATAMQAGRWPAVAETTVDVALLPE